MALAGKIIMEGWFGFVVKAQSVGLLNINHSRGAFAA
jgi:hypothetical protein